MGLTMFTRLQVVVPQLHTMGQCRVDLTEHFLIKGESRYSVTSNPLLAKDVGENGERFSHVNYRS